MKDNGGQCYEEAPMKDKGGQCYKEAPGKGNWLAFCLSSSGMNSSTNIKITSSYFWLYEQYAMQLSSITVILIILFFLPSTCRCQYRVRI